MQRTRTMQRPQAALAVLIVLGGFPVLGSYALAFTYSPEVREALWGDIPQILLRPYVACMLLAAAGFFPFTYQLLLTPAPEALGRRRPYAVLLGLYALVLIPSALWLPLTARYILAPEGTLWWTIRGVLALVGLGSSGLVVVLWILARRRGGVLAWLALVGGFFFWLQTAVLDAIVWPFYFPGS